MARIYAKDNKYNGISAGINFVNGVGVSTDSRLISWFEENGYHILPELNEMNYKELTEYAKSKGLNGIGMKKDELLQLLKETEESNA
nr:MAG TPA: HeH/LEM domain [Caudoviricetes sp.]